MDLSARLEIFLTVSEAHKLLRKMDVNNDDKVDEADFLMVGRAIVC